MSPADCRRRGRGCQSQAAENGPSAALRFALGRHPGIHLSACTRSAPLTGGRGMSRFVVDEKKCRRDGICVAVCPVGVLTPRRRRPAGAGPGRGGAVHLLRALRRRLSLRRLLARHDAGRGLPPRPPRVAPVSRAGRAFPALAPLHPRLQGRRGGLRPARAPDPHRALRAVGAQQPAGALAGDLRARAGARDRRARDRLDALDLRREAGGGAQARCSTASSPPGTPAATRSAATRRTWSWRTPPRTTSRRRAPARWRSPTSSWRPRRTASAPAGRGTCTWAALHWQPLQQALALPAGDIFSGALMVGEPRYRYYRLPTRREPAITWR